MAFAQDGRTLAAAYSDDRATLWDTTDPAAPQQRGSLSGGAHHQVNAMTFTSDGHVLAAYSFDTSVDSADYPVTLWDISNPGAPERRGSELAVPTVVGDMAFAPDGQTLVAVGSSDTMIVWDTTNPGAPAG